MFDRGNLKQSSAKWRRVLNESPFRQQMKLITIPASWSLISNSFKSGILTMVLAAREIGF